jgi:hypothetical protein
MSKLFASYTKQFINKEEPKEKSTSKEKKKIEKPIGKEIKNGSSRDRNNLTDKKKEVDKKLLNANIKLLIEEKS